MIEVIPAINATTWSEVEKKLRHIELVAEWAHLDVADGTFTPNVLWHNSLDLVHFETPLKLEVHMMEDDPEVHLSVWLLKPVKRIIVHYEVAHAIDHIIKECHAHGVEVGLSIADKTSWTVLKPWIGKVDLVQVLAVPPGKAGQHFHAHNLSKVKHLRALSKDAKIEIDGGMNPDTAEAAVTAGANIIAAASYIFSHPSPKLAMKELIPFKEYLKQKNLA